ncbi:hypothetical protein BHM03_00048538 [Ensete ventricosum]|nr:hypothetical protein BHM03_00048538 [Ensete ventricosum]
MAVGQDGEEMKMVVARKEEGGCIKVAQCGQRGEEGEEEEVGEQRGSMRGPRWQRDDSATGSRGNDAVYQWGRRRSGRQQRGLRHGCAVAAGSRGDTIVRQWGRRSGQQQRGLRHGCIVAARSRGGTIVRRWGRRSGRQQRVVAAIGKGNDYRGGGNDGGWAADGKGGDCEKEVTVVGCSGCSGR